jgi:excisionase family DNA binding protein
MSLNSDHFPEKMLVRFHIATCSIVLFDFDYFEYIIMEEVTPMSAAASPTPTIPSEDDVKLAKETRKILSLRLSSNMPLDLREMSMPQESPIRIPAPAAHLLVQILDEMSRGNAVKLLPIHAELTTQEAADLLNVSRPTLIRLLNEGKIEFHKVGTHRRVPFKSALAYKRQIDEERKAVLAELVAYDQELGI